MMHFTRTARALLCATLALAAIVGLERFQAVTRAADQWRIVENWPQLPPGMVFGSLSGVTVDKKGIIYVFERNALGDVWMFDKSGRFLGKWGPSGKPGFVKMAHTMHIDPEGFFWITDRTGNQLKKFTPEGKLLLTVGTGQPGHGPDTFNGPTGMQFLANGEFMVSDGYWNNRVAWFDKNGKFLRSIGATQRPPTSMEGRGPGNFGLVHAAAQLTDGRVLVSDLCDGPIGPEDEGRRNKGCTDSRVQLIDKNGKFVEFWNQYHGPLCMTRIGDRIYLAEGNRIFILDAKDGAQLDVVPDGRTSTAGGAAGAHQIAADATGDNFYAVFLGNSPGIRSGGKGVIRRYTREPK